MTTLNVSKKAQQEETARRCRKYATSLPYSPEIEQKEAEVWTGEDQAAWLPLNCKLQRINSRKRRDKKRVRKFSPHKKAGGDQA